ncbi:MAG: ATP phosphoribosyltransferase [candidate division NC10 bacterium RIFCSPLOWO2_12_FULL_66_18]|nr:MAG: ATP phosphoribosyltransferase [candidate division NC10 bacterium RIFCSPLOWO2_02_FULL_66_22]OGB97915.1 MAG: ATP phosphoribosyltransferase [candidate division NC10 bacterium RIFCSPLOWO2_12_FULL_66_18]
MANDLIAVALPTGRLFRDAVKLFADLGATGVEALRESRRLTAEDPARGLRFLALKAVDIPIYVEHGAADMGIVGKDLLLEQGRDVYEPLDLGFGACRLVVAEPASLRSRDDPRAWSCLRVATKYPRLTERHFSQKGIQVEIVHLSGSIELAPAMGLAERIVDLVATGRTLRENGLVEVEEVQKASARLIVNRASLKTRYRAIQAVIEALRLRVALRGGVR